MSRPGTQRRRAACWFSVLALLGAACSTSDPAGEDSQAAPAPRAAAQGPGPAVGETLPPFEAPDQTGRVWTFESLHGPEGLVLNVNRSVVW